MNITSRIKNKSAQTAINASAHYVVRHVQKNPEKNFDSVIRKLISLDGMFTTQGQFSAVMNWIQTHSGTRQWFINLMQKDPKQVETFIKNFFGNCSLKWMEKADHLEKESGICPPYTILFSPTMRCNLHCKGCYAADYCRGKSDDMDIATMEKIIHQGKELGVYFYTVLGGEPFMVFDDICTVAQKHSDCLFQIFTNGTLITQEVADRIQKLGNIVIAFSVNGSREDTEYMRGPGVYERVLESISHMRERSLMYGMSLVLTSRNYTTLMSRDFLKFWENQGVVFGWNFLYMPVGPKPDISLMPTPRQRLAFGEFIKKYREEEPLYFMDFWADAPSVHGCIAGGRRYLHINNKGDIEPCIFAHHATHNIHTSSLREALQSPFFTYIRMNQPHTDNLLRPCMIIDNPEIWRTACKKFNAKPTDHGAEEIINNPEIIRALDDYSEEAAEFIDPVWIRDYQAKIKDMYDRKRSYGEGIDRIEFNLNRLEFLNRITGWAKKNPDYAKSMLESLSDVFRRYGSDKKRHIQLIKAVQPEHKKRSSGKTPSPVTQP